MSSDEVRLIRAIFDESVAAQQRFSVQGSERVEQAAGLIGRALSTGHLLLAFGNGGSAGDAEHFVAELVGRFDPRGIGDAASGSIWLRNRRHSWCADRPFRCGL